MPVSVMRPTRGSRSSSRMISASSRWIWSAMRARRESVIEELRDRARDLDHLEDLDLVAHLDVVEVLERQPALEPGLHLAHVVLEALERIELAGVDHDAGTNEPHGGAAPHHAVGHHAA